MFNFSLEGVLWWLMSWLPWLVKQAVMTVVGMFLPALILYGVWRWYGAKRLRGWVTRTNARLPGFAQIPLPREYKEGEVREVLVHKPSFFQRQLLRLQGLIVAAPLYAGLAYYYGLLKI